MSVMKCKDRKGYKYQFRFNKERYQEYFDTADEADKAETRKRNELLDAEQGVVTPVALTTPVAVAAQGAGAAAMALSFNIWAGLVLAHEREKLENAKYRRPQDEIERLIAGREMKLRIVLRFFGHKPEKETPMNRNTKTKAIYRYHNLTLADPILRPEWIDDFEDYLIACGYDGQSKNNYRSAASGLYTLAMSRKFHRQSGISRNPFLGLERDSQIPRDVVPTEHDLRRVIKEASPHLQLALLIALYAPELRVGSILALTWADIDYGMTTITVADHKNAGRRKGKKQIVPIIARLRRILDAAKADPNRNHDCDVIVQYQGRGIESIRRAVEGACERCTPPVAYGLAEANGITFHSIRHFIGTEAARMRLSKDDRKALLDHDSDAMSDHYNHLTGEDTRQPMEALGAQLDRILAGEVELRYLPTRQAKGQRSDASKNVRTFAPRNSLSGSKVAPKVAPTAVILEPLAFQKPS